MYSFYKLLFPHFVINLTDVREKIEPKILASDFYQGENCHFQLAGCESASQYMFCDTYWDESECSGIDWDKFDREWEAYRTRVARPVSCS